ENRRDPGDPPQQGDALSLLEASADIQSHPDQDSTLPQCTKGSRKVDDMCFMISCTNWY
ncbi:hypothetical protein DNTS_015394, partial [Danionella cerebrum]